MASKTFASPTLSSTPSDIEVITEMDVFEASAKEDVPRPPSSPVAPTSVKGFKWEKLVAPLKEAAEKPVDKPAEEPVAKEEPAAKEEPVEEPKKKPVEEPEAKSEDDMPPLVEDSDSDDDMPPLVEDSDSEGLPELVNSSDDEMLIAVFRRPTCNRCDAALHAILDPEDSDEETPSPRRRQDNCPSVITYTAAIFGLFYLIKIYLILTGGAFIVGPGYYGSCL
jgi:hypothetical protein